MEKKWMIVIWDFSKLIRSGLSPRHIVSLLELVLTSLLRIHAGRRCNQTWVWEFLQTASSAGNQRTTSTSHHVDTACTVTAAGARWPRVRDQSSVQYATFLSRKVSNESTAAQMTTYVESVTKHLSTRSSCHVDTRSASNAHTSGSRKRLSVHSAGNREHKQELSSLMLNYLFHVII